MQVFTGNYPTPVGQGLAWIACLPLALWFSSCASTSLPSRPASAGKEQPAYEVIAEKAPFYLKQPAKGKASAKSYPYLYLPKGTPVSLLKNAGLFSKVSLVNAMEGWIPILDLAPQMASDGDAESAVTPVPSPAARHPAARGKAAGFNPDSAVTLPSYD